MSTQVVTYQLDDVTAVSFEIEPTEGFRPASPGHALGKIRDAVAPSVGAAKIVLDKIKEICPDEIELTFGIKVNGGTDWLIAKSAGEASFEIKLTWSPEGRQSGKQPEAATAVGIDSANAAVAEAAEPTQK